MFMGSDLKDVHDFKIKWMILPFNHLFSKVKYDFNYYFLKREKLNKEILTFKNSLSECHNLPDYFVLWPHGGDRDT